MTRKTRGFWGGLFVLGLGTATLYLGSLASRPDLDIVFEREVMSPLSPEVIGKSLQYVANWPRWHHMASAAAVKDASGRDLPLAGQILEKGSLVDIQIDPRGETWRRFHLGLKVLDYQPGKSVSLELVKDTTAKILKIFSHMDWTISIVPQPGGGSLLHATVRAHTSHWRSRLFEGLAPRVLMNQVFWVDLPALASLDQPYDGKSPLPSPTPVKHPD